MDVASVTPGIGAEEFDARIASLAAGGEGVARAPDGRVVFVADTVPGDRVRVRVLETRRRFARGEVVVLHEPGPSRREPFCPVHAVCGGCTWQHVDYETQVASKREILHDALARIGGVTVPPDLHVEPSPMLTGWRRRARVGVSRGRVGFRRRRSRELVATEHCPVLDPSLDAALGSLSDRPPSDGEWELLLGAEARVRAEPLGARGRSGTPLDVAVGSDRLRVSTGVFVQSHGPLLATLVDAVAAAAGGGGRALELHAGAGFFTLALARRFDRVVAVECDRAAVRDLRHNLRRADLTNVRVRDGRVEAVLAGRRALARPVDVVVADPPRAGLPRGAAPRLAALTPERIVLLSCDPATLARDVAALRAERYALRSVRGFDLFPHTPHLEALAVLERDDA